MTDPVDVLRESPVDFGAAVAYALHPEMRRLLILYLVGTLLLPVGVAVFIDPGHFGILREIVRRVVGLIVAVVGATFLFGGLVGAVFKLVTDANILAMNR